MKYAALLALCASLTLPAAGRTQQVPVRLGGGVTFQLFNFSEPGAVQIERVSLLTVPLAARVGVARNVTVEALGAFASGRLERSDGTVATLAGPTDAELRLLLGLANGTVTITGIVQAPTGSSSLTLAEADVAGVIASDVLPFRISNWGTGGGGGLALSLTRPLGNGVAGGLTVGYVMALEFTPLENAFTYRPGNQLSLRAALDKSFGESGKGSLVVSMQHYNADQVDDANLFQAGQRYEAMGSYAFSMGRGAGIVFAGYLHRNEGEYLTVARVLPVEGLFFGGLGLEMRAGNTLVRPRADVRVLRRDDGVGQGYTASAGADLEIPFARVSVTPTLRALFGNLLLRQNAESSFTGFEAGLSLRFGALR